MGEDIEKEGHLTFMFVVCLLMPFEHVSHSPFSHELH